MPKKKAGKAKKAAPKYEDVRARLEEVVSDLERGEGTLEESLALYEEGVKLVRASHGMLDSAEKRLEILKPLPDGSFQVKDRTGEFARPAEGAGDGAAGAVDEAENTE